MPSKKLNYGFKSVKQRNRLEKISNRHSTKRQLQIFQEEHSYSNSCNFGPGQNENLDLPNLNWVDRDVFVAEEEVSELWDGCRIVELSVLAQGLSACKACGQPLQLKHATDVTNRGLAAYIKVPCLNTLCGTINSIPTGTKKGKQFEINEKIGSVLNSCGIGASIVNYILTTLDIRPVSHSMLDERSRGAGVAVENVAVMSTEQFLQIEKALTKQKTGEEKLTVSVDAGWQKRGSGKSHDSSSGHCSMIGSETGKVIEYSLRSKTCRVCGPGDSKLDHEGCSKNWQGSSKAMEPDMVMSMVEKVEKKGAEIGTLVGDDDSTLTARLKTMKPHIMKISDRNHIKKNFTNMLFAVKKDHKSLSVSVITYLRKLFSYVISQNKGDSEGIKQGLLSMAHHPFGDHKQCNQSWCVFLRNGEQQKYKALPYGRPLNDKKLQDALNKQLQRYADQGEKLSALGSTQANESFNKTVASKAPKHCHNSGSASLRLRLAASVVHKNYGNGGILATHKAMGVKVGKNTKRYALLRDRAAARQKAVASTRAFKKRRFELKSKKRSRMAAAETREGISYQPEIGLTHDAADELIPPPTRGLRPDPVSVPHTNAVFFDLEATGLSRTSHITQICAKRADSIFSTYVLPKKAIEPRASEITGLCCRNGKLYHNGTEVKALPIKDALKGLFEFLGSSDRNIIYGHNIQSYDCHILLNALNACGMTDMLHSHLEGFVDTLKLFKSFSPGLTSYSQKNLVESLLQRTYAAHDAIEDVKALEQLVRVSSIPPSVIEKVSFSVAYAIESNLQSSNIRKNSDTFSVMLREKIISTATAKKMAGSGLRFAHLQMAFDRNGNDGVTSLLTELNESGFPRVTRSKKIITGVIDFLSRKVSEQ